MKMARILLFTLVLLPAVVAAQQGQVPPELIVYPELILHNGKVLTVDANFRVAEAVAIRSGVFLSIATNAEVLRLRGPETKVINLAGRTVIPGFIATDGDGAPVADALYKDTQIGGKLLGTQQNLRT